MVIHEMYGRLAEQQESTEASRRFLYELLVKLKSGEVAPAQLEELPDGGFKVNPVPNDVENDSYKDCDASQDVSD